MMHAIRTRRRIESETLHLPELRSMLGKDVEIIILEESEQKTPEHSLAGSVLRFDDPLDPIAEDDWEAGR